MAAKTPHELHTIFVKAFNAGDIDTLCSLYEDGAKFSQENGEVLQGVPAIREVCKAFLSLNGKMVLDTTYVTQVDDIALLSGAWSLTGSGAGQESALEMSGATSEVARRQADGTWRYLIDYPYGTKQVK